MEIGIRPQQTCIAPENTVFHISLNRTLTCHASLPRGVLTTDANVVTFANVPAQLITRFEDVTPDGAILEVVIWKVPKPVPPADHGYKYSAVNVVDGVRIVGFDNERGKGDHCHLDGGEVPYTFTGVDQLIEDFIAAVAARRAP
jgi:hypothetical protein